jgi:hypothetical protein
MKSERDLFAAWLRRCAIRPVADGNAERVEACATCEEGMMGGALMFHGEQSEK